MYTLRVGHLVFVFLRELALGGSTSCLALLCEPQGRVTQVAMFIEVES